ncbi:MAG: hypothetical protein RQ731_04570 [Anaerosomatales bacterium]|nr:hypothetical protein [Anaerosomatales bacterium]MDT8434016.1 hypothetical protein [Anaerosomatales bacterium]
MNAETLVIAGYVAAIPTVFTAAIAAWIDRVTAARWSLAASAGLLCAVAAVRWVVTAHPPIFGTHENAIASALALIITAWFMVRPGSDRAHSAPAALLTLFACVTLVYGLFFETALYPLTISERSLWVDLHVLLAWLAYAQLLAAVAVAIVALAGIADASIASSASQLGRLGLGFAAFTAMTSVGAFYSFQLFSDWFRWEVVESLAAASWVALGLVIHGRQFWGWREKRLAAATVMLLPLIVLTYWIWSLYAGTYHYFEIPMITAGGI